MTTARQRSPRRAAASAKPAEDPHTVPIPLATSVVGSYSVPEWLERVKTDYYQRHISGAYLKEIHETAIKAAIKDHAIMSAKMGSLVCRAYSTPQK